MPAARVRPGSPSALGRRDSSLVCFDRSSVCFRCWRDNNCCPQVRGWGVGVFPTSHLDLFPQARQDLFPTVPKTVPIQVRASFGFAVPLAVPNNVEGPAPGNCSAPHYGYFGMAALRHLMASPTAAARLGVPCFLSAATTLGLPQSVGISSSSRSSASSLVPST